MKAYSLLAAIGIMGSGVLVGQLTAASSEPPARRSGPSGGAQPVAGGGEVFDVTPCVVGITVQAGEVGTYPDGTVGLGVSTTGQNIGNVKLPWFRSPNVHHPVITQNMFRISPEGRLEQIGMSWLKHGFTAVQQETCGACIPHGNGNQLGIGCSDTYGAELNANQFWLGPRWEVRPNQHIWMDGRTWDGSHFARNAREGDSAPHNPVEHRLRVHMQDIVDQNAEYYVEAIYYLMRKIDDQNWMDLRELPENTLDNAGHRKILIDDDQSGEFAFVMDGNSITGPLLLQWGDMQSPAAPMDDGVVLVSSRSVDLGGGMHRYEYAVMNLSMDREIGGISIPIQNAVASNFGFHAPKDGYFDEDGDFVNESPYDLGVWEVSVADGMVSLVPPPPSGALRPNAIRYGMTYTFWFDANSGPTTSQSAVITPRLPGDVDFVAAGIVSPDFIPVGERAELIDFNVGHGTHLEGDVADADASDDTYLLVRSSLGRTIFEPFYTEVDFQLDSSPRFPTNLTLRLESHVDDPAGIVKVFVLNRKTGQFDQVDTFPVGLNDITRVIPDLDASTYVHQLSGDIDIRLRHIVFGKFFTFSFETSIDLVEAWVD